MKRSAFIIVAAVLLLPACEKKSVEESVTAKAPPTSAGQSAPLAAEQPAPPPTMEKAQEKSLSAPAASKAPAPAEAEKPAEASGGGKEESINRDEMLALASKSGCMVCHKIDSKLIGPSWLDVSKRYKGAPNARADLVKNIKLGSKGNWTEVSGGIPMPPNSPRVSDENIEKLVAFILSL